MNAHFYGDDNNVKAIVIDWLETLVDINTDYDLIRPLIDVILGALVKEPEDRYSIRSIFEMLIELSLKAHYVAVLRNLTRIHDLLQIATQDTHRAQILTAQEASEVWLL